MVAPVYFLFPPVRVLSTVLYVLLASADITAHEAHRDRFFVIAAVGTVIYFLAAYGELRRRTAHTRRTLAQHDDSSPSGSGPAPRHDG